MISIKTDEEIEAIRLGGDILSRILDEVEATVKPGTSSAELEEISCRLIEEAGGRPAFKDYYMGDNIYFPNALCVSINNEVVHGAATPGRELKSGDIVGCDIGMEWPITKKKREELGLPTNKHSKLGGYYTDMSRTVAVGKISKEAKQLMKVTKKALELAIEQVKPGNNLNDIGSTIQDYAESHGYGVVRELVGHGVGHQAHEDPAVVNYALDENDPENIVLKTGMVIAIEPMINIGGWRIKTGPDGFTILTSDGSLSAHFEHTIAVTEKGHKVLTRKS